MNEKKTSVYYRFVKKVLKEAKINCKRFPNKYDPRKYGVWAHACLLTLKQLEDKTYRFLVDMISEMPGILNCLTLSKHPTGLPCIKQPNAYETTL